MYFILQTKLKLELLISNQPIYIAHLGKQFNV